MAKNMARIKNGIVTNVEWCSDMTAETDTLKNINDRPVGIGDTYCDGIFYRDGEKIMTHVERLADAENALAILYGGTV